MLSQKSFLAALERAPIPGVTIQQALAVKDLVVGLIAAQQSDPKGAASKGAEAPPQVLETILSPTTSIEPLPGLEWYHLAKETAGLRYPEPQRARMLANEFLAAQSRRNAAFTASVDAEISDRLALAIGWDRDDVQIVTPKYGRATCEVWLDNEWKSFDYKHWHVLTPVCDRYRISASRCYEDISHRGNWRGHIEGSTVSVMAATHAEAAILTFLSGKPDPGRTP